MHELQSAAEMNVRSPFYFIAHTCGVCPNCESLTDLYAFLLPPGHETLNIADDDEPEPAMSDWVVANHYALVFHIELLSERAAVSMTTLTQTFRIGRSFPEAEPAWANHCEACGCQLSDEPLFCEPGQPFFPTSAEAASKIRLLRIDEPLQLSAGSYSLDPEFVDAMTSG